MLKLLHVDDHPAIRKAAEDALAAEFKGLECVGVDSYAQGLQALSEHRFDAVLLDLMINEQFELHQIKRFTAQAKTIVWSMRFNYGIIRTALDHGARAVIGKHEPLETLVHAVATVADAQKFFLSAEGQAILAEGGLRTGYLPPGYYDLHQLSGREIQVLRLAGQGYCIQDSARLLKIKPKTVETFRRRVREKLGLDGSGEFLRFAFCWVAEGQPCYLKYP